MTTLEKKEYWTPVDQFILKVVEKYRSLAMLGPRIQSPYDLIRNEDINSTVRMFRFTKYVKNFYLDFLRKNSLMKPDILFENMIDREDPEQKLKIISERGGINIDSFTQNASDISIMSHPPMIGHWMKESGLLSVDDMKQDHEFSYEEYMRLFTMKKEQKGVNLTRKHLYPSFEGLLVTTAHVGWSKDDDGKKCIHEELISTIYAMNEDISFNSGNGTYDMYTPRELFTYGFMSNDEERPDVKGEKIINTAYVTRDRPHYIPLSIFNDKTFTRDDTNAGFFSTNISYAYHMSFDLNASYEFIYPKEITLPIVGKKIKKYTSLDQHARTAGRIITTRPKVDIKDCVIEEIDSKEMKLKHVKEQNFLMLLSMMGNLEDKCKDEAPQLLKMWYNLPVISSPNNILIDRSVYSSYYDYYHHDVNLEAIMSKPMSNYFWLLYGALPINNIYFEDLEKALNTNSFLNYEKETDSTKWNTTDMQEILVYNRGFLATESNKDELLLVYRQAIKFLALIWGLSQENINSLSEIHMHYAPNSGGSVISSEVKFEVLGSIYPKFTSLNYVEPPKVVKVDVAPRNIDEKVMASGIALKLEKDDPILSKDDFDFMYRTDILDDKDKIIYESLGRKVDGVDEAKLKILIKNIKDKTQRITDFIGKAVVDVNELVSIPPELKAIDEDVKFSEKGASIRPKDIEVIRRIKRYILNESPAPQYVSKDMILYLYSWRVIPSTPPKEFTARYIKGPGPGSASAYHYLKVDTDDSPEYKEFKDALSKFDVENDASFNGFTALDIEGKDRNVISKDRPRGDGSKKGGDKQDQKQSGGQSGNQKPGQKLTKAQKKALRKNRQGGNG